MIKAILRYLGVSASACPQAAFAVERSNHMVAMSADLTPMQALGEPMPFLPPISAVAVKRHALCDGNDKIIEKPH
ncbi:MAG TPA: hypothetical protein VEU53_13325 [Stellaceae bacterium]|nr:hypothetical protein [Stellaceae bacterium]